MTAVAIVDDHALLAQALADALRRAGFDACGVVAAADADVESTLAALRPDVVILDLDLGPLGSSLTMIPALRAAGSTVVVVTGELSRARWGECIQAGANTVIAKAVSFDNLLDDLKQLLAGETTMPLPERQALIACAEEQERDERQRLAPFRQLTAREAAVLDKLMDGLSADEIAAETYVSITTVRSHIRAILQKLRVNSQLAAVALAVRCDWQYANPQI